MLSLGDLSNIALQSYRVISIDPGSTNMGISVYDVDLLNNSVKLVECETFHADKLLRHNTHLLDTHSALDARLLLLGKALTPYVETYFPNVVIVEDCYFRRNPLPFKVLTMCQSMVKNIVYMYNPLCKVVTITPSDVKQGVGVNGGSNVKDDMTVALAELIANGRIITDVTLEVLDDHAIDSACIGYGYIVNVLGGSLQW